MDNDQFYMEIALSILERYIGTSFPNPTVVALIVESDKDFKNSKIISFGITQSNGRPHAEFNAINKVNFKANKYYKLYSTLEPCCHKGRDISCVELIIKKKINEVIFSLNDPDRRMRGMGKKILIKNGIKVNSGILEKKTKILYAGYIFNRQKNRPRVTLKIASSLDGKISHKSSTSSRITNNLSKKTLHLLRSKFDAILVGSNTVRIDNPKLNCRLNGLRKLSPIRVTISKDLNLNPDLNFIKNIENSRTIIFTQSLENSNLSKYQSSNLDIITLEEKNYNLKHILKILSNYNIFNLMVEGGAKIFSSFLSDDLFDELILFQSNFFIGEEGQSTLEKGYLDLSKKKFKLKQVTILDNDTMKIFEKKN